MRVDTSNLHRASAGVQQAYQNMQNTPKADYGISIAQGAKGIADSLGMYLDYQSKDTENKAREIALTEQEKTSQGRIEAENNKNELAKVQSKKDIELIPLMQEAQMQQLTAQAGMFKKINESDDLTKNLATQKTKTAQKAKATQTKTPAQKTQATPAQPQATTPINPITTPTLASMDYKPPLEESIKRIVTQAKPDQALTQKFIKNYNANSYKLPSQKPMGFVDDNIFSRE